MESMQIHLVKTRLVNSYIVAYADRLLVVDVAIGCHEHVAAFITGQLKRKLTEIAFITCTHDDPDHLGGIHELAQWSGAATGLPYASKSFRRKFINDPQALFYRFFTLLRELFRPRAWAMYASSDRANQSTATVRALLSETAAPPGRDSPVKQQPPSVTRIKDKQSLKRFDDWQLIHTPGHSWDSCCYYHSATGSLISGDTLLGSSRRGQLVAPAILANPKHLRQSYARLSVMDIRSVYPGHGSIMEGKNLIHKDLL